MNVGDTQQASELTKYVQHCGTVCLKFKNFKAVFSVIIWEGLGYNLTLVILMRFKSWQLDAKSTNYLVDAKMLQISVPKMRLAQKSLENFQSLSTDRGKILHGHLTSAEKFLWYVGNSWPNFLEVSRSFLLFRWVLYMVKENKSTHRKHG